MLAQQGLPVAQEAAGSAPNVSLVNSSWVKAPRGTQRATLVMRAHFQGRGPQCAPIVLAVSSRTSQARESALYASPAVQVSFVLIAKAVLLAPARTVLSVHSRQASTRMIECVPYAAPVPSVTLHSVRRHLNTANAVRMVSSSPKAEWQPVWRVKRARLAAIGRIVAKRARGHVPHVQPVPSRREWAILGMPSACHVLLVRISLNQASPAVWHAPRAVLACCGVAAHQAPQAHA